VNAPGQSRPPLRPSAYSSDSDGGSDVSQTGRGLSGRPPWPQHVREVIRYKIGWWLAEPFWRVHLIGERALNVSTRLVRWGERASR
jgi:hypothetical protein